MEYILSFLILVLNLFNYEHSIGVAVFFAAGTLIMTFLFYTVFKKTHSFLTTCLVLMCYTWQISWINIFGKPTAELQLPWFYILGAMMLAYGILNFKKCLSKKYSVPVLVAFSAFLLLFNYPVLISPDKSAAMKEYIPIAFFVIVLFVCFMFKDDMSPENYEYFKSAFIWAVFISALALIFQYIMYTYAGISLFKMSVMLSFSGYQTNCYLLMEDHSCATIMFGCAVFYIIERIDKKRWFYMIPVMLSVLVAMALTARRTSTISLVVVLAFYVILHYKGVGKKITFTALFCLAAFVMLYYLLITRPVDSLSQIISSNGRIETYIAALNVIKTHPFGVGYDEGYLLNLLNGVITPHNTLLRWMCMGGVLFAAFLVFIIVSCMYTGYKKRAYPEFWAILYAFFASNFIPDILNARFFVIICSAVFLLGRERKNDGQDRLYSAGLSTKR